MMQESYGAAPTFDAIHNSTTTTEIIFSEVVNGTLNNQNWFINGIQATAATNGTTPSAAGNNYAATTDGFLNKTTYVMLTHATINPDDALVVKYIISGQLSGQPDIVAANVGNLRDWNGHAATEIIANGTSDLARDGISPNVVSAKKTGQKSIEVTMNEPVGNQNATGTHFTLYGTLDSVVSSVVANNGTTKLLLTTRNIINDFDTVTLSFGAGSAYFLTDSTNSPYHGNGDDGSDAGVAHHFGNDGKTELGNRLMNFTGLIVTIPPESTDNTPRISPHLHDEVLISVNSDDDIFMINVHEGNVPNIQVFPDDVVDITISIGDDYRVEDISQIKLITNYDDQPSDMNQYFTTNFDKFQNVGLSIYEWNQVTDDLAYDYTGLIAWDEPTLKIQKRTQTYHEYTGPLLFDENELLVTYSIKINDEMSQSEVGIKITDSNYNIFESFLPFTLEVLPNKNLDNEYLNPDESILSEEFVDEPLLPSNNLNDITMSANLESYQNGNKVIINGQIQNYNFNSMKGQNILYDIISPENIILSSGHIAPNSDGSFYFTTFAMDNLWKIDGNYIFSVNLSSLKQTVDISYDNTEFEPVIFESIPEATTIPVIPEATTIPVIPEATTIPVIPEATTATPIIPEATTATPIIPEATTPLSNSNIMCGAGTEDVNGICQIAKTEINNSSNGGGCLIATAAYGSEMSPQVQLLREIRDNQLMNTESGSAFMGTFNEMYYSFSPIVADMQRDSPIFKEIVKVGLTPMLSSLSIMENANSESEVLGLGLSIIMLNIGMYLGVPAIVIIGIRKKF